MLSNRIKKGTSLLLISSILLINSSMTFTESNTTEIIETPYNSRQSTSESYVTFETRKEATIYLRDEMEKRNTETIRIRINISECYEDLARDIYEDAISEEYGSKPTHGDYLAGHIKNYSLGISKKDEQYVYLSFTFTYYSTYKQEQELNKKIDTILNKLNVWNSSKYTKIKAVYDYMIKNVDYDYDIEKRSAYNALVNELVVCQGYSTATYRLLEELGVDCRCITGDVPNGHHAWNIAKIGSNWYNLDTTWDAQNNTYNYFLKGSTNFNKDHTSDSKYDTNAFHSKYPISTSDYNGKNVGNSSDDKIIQDGIRQSLTKDIYKYDAGKGKYLTYINGKGYSQYSYLNKSGKYAFTPSSWMKAAGLNVTMPTESNGYTMKITNPYITMYNQSNTLLEKIKSGEISKENIQTELDKIENNKHINISISNNTSTSKPSYKKSLTKDIYKYDAGKGKYLTYINGKGYSQYSYLNVSGKYAFTSTSWMEASGLEITMPTSSNGYVTKINNPYVKEYNKNVNIIKSYLE